MSAQTATNLHTTCRLISFGSLSSPTFAKAHMTRFLGHSSRDVLGGKARLSGPATASVTRFPVPVSESQFSLRQFEQVRLGTCFALQSARLLQEAYTHGVGFAIETPDPRPGVVSIFTLPEFLALSDSEG